jgi:hypothetical protein
MQKSTSHRATLGAYIRAGRHMVSENKAKTIPQIASEIGMSTTTARHWLKADHYAEWLEWWPSVEALFAEWQQKDRRAAPQSFDFPDFDPAADDVR